MLMRITGGYLVSTGYEYFDVELLHMRKVLLSASTEGFPEG